MKKTAKFINLWDVGRKSCADGVSKVVVKKGSLTMVLQEKDGVCVLPSGQLAWIWGV